MLLENNILGSLVLGVGFFLMIFLIEVWTRKKSPAPELSRKAVHMAGGMGCILFPFLVTSPYYVAVLALMFSSFFIISRKFKILKSLTSVERKSRGSEYYPIAVFLVYLISWHNEKIWLYIATILILAVSDAVAALVGGEYGKIKYSVGTAGDKKSLEGSLFFLIITYLSIQIPLLLMTDIPKGTAVLAPFLLAILLTGVEAISDKGRDNIFVPLFTCYGLLKITQKPVSEVLFQCISLIVIIIVVVILIRSIKLFTVTASILFIISTYGVWSLGSYHWAIPLFAAFFLFYINRNNKKREFGNQQVEVSCLIKILFVPMAILLIANAMNLYEILFGSFMVSIILAYSCVEWSFLIKAYQIKDKHRPVMIILSGIIPGVLILSSVSVSQMVFLIQPVLITLLIVVLSLFGFDFYLRNNTDRVLMLNRGYSVMCLSLFGGVLYLILQFIVSMELWSPVY